MVVKAKKGKAIGCAPAREPVEFSESERYVERDKDEDQDEEDLIMVMFPRITFDAVQDLAVKYGSTFGETINAALKLLEQTVEKKGES